MDQDINKKSEFCTVIQRQKILYVHPIHLTHQNGQMTCSLQCIKMASRYNKHHTQTTHKLNQIPANDYIIII